MCNLLYQSFINLHSPLNAMVISFLCIYSSHLSLILSALILLERKVCKLRFYHWDNPSDKVSHFRPNSIFRSSRQPFYNWISHSLSRMRLAHEHQNQRPSYTWKTSICLQDLDFSLKAFNQKNNVISIFPLNDACLG